MANNALLPSSSSNGLLGKIKSIFKSVFSKKGKSPLDEAKIEYESNNSSEKNFMDGLKNKTDVDGACDKEVLEYVANNVESKPEILNNLTIEQLEDVNRYYDGEIQKIEEKINKLKNKQ